MKLLKSHQSFDGQVQFWEHSSLSTKTTMKFSVFLPPGQIRGALIWLSGLTCTDENFITKAGALKYLAQLGLMIICPDTSPRGLNLPKERDSWEFGEGASFYLNATTPFYQDHYQMYDYIRSDIYQILRNHFGMSDQPISIMGHSMGGHGALILGLREQGKFQSISAYAPISHPTKTYWRNHVFPNYLGKDENAWSEYDACELIKNGFKHPHCILIDQGRADTFFLEGKLATDNLEKIAQQNNQPIKVRWHDAYDHSYYFISTFIESHIAFHATAMQLI